jgi:hypothetical protein
LATATELGVEEERMRTPQLAAGCNKPASEPRESIEVQRKHKGVARRGVETFSERTSVLGASRNVKSAEGRKPRKNPTRVIVWQQAVIGTRESLKKRRRKEGCAEISTETSTKQRRSVKALRAHPKG